MQPAPRAGAVSANDLGRRREDSTRPRIAITFVGLAALLTFLSTRLVVPAGMRWAFRRRPPAAASGPIVVGPDSDPAQPTLEEIGEVEQ